MGKAFKVERQRVVEPGHDGCAPIMETPKGAAAWEEAGDLVQHNVNIDRVRFLYHKRAISSSQYEGACALQRDWEMAMILPQASSILVGNGASGGGATLPNDARVAAMRRKGNAMAAVPVECRRIVELVVIDNMTIGKVAGIVKAHHQFATALLHVGLNAIAREYGYCS